MILVIGGFCQGQKEFAKTLSEDKEMDIREDVHLFIREGLLAGKDREEILRELLSECGENVIFTCDEVGCGIVPMEAFEREYRESVGRIMCRLAKEAKTCYRVAMGIGTRIK